MVTHLFKKIIINLLLQAQTHSTSLSIFFTRLIVLRGNLTSIILGVIFEYKLSIKQYNEMPNGSLPNLVYAHLCKLNSASNSQVTCQWVYYPATETNLNRRIQQNVFFATTNAISWDIQTCWWRLRAFINPEIRANLMSAFMLLEMFVHPLFEDPTKRVFRPAVPAFKSPVTA